MPPNQTLSCGGANPEGNKEEFRGTDYEFQRVLLPVTTLSCQKARIDPLERCHEDPMMRQGQVQGACDNEVNALQKVLAISLRDMTFEVPPAERSPGYQTIVNLKITQLQMNKMLHRWVEKGRTGLGARAAVCEFVFENRDELISYFPEGYPRVTNAENEYQQGLLYTAQSFGGLALVYVVTASGMVFYWRNTGVFASVQRSFIFLILFGLLLVVSFASILYALEPQDPICVSQIWMINLGYTLELVPLLVKVAAIKNRLILTAAQNFRRIRIDPRQLILTVVGVTIVVILVLTAWTIVDPPRRQVNQYLMDNEGSISLLVLCDSESMGWSILARCWEGILIAAAVVLAFQSRKVKGEFNSSTHLGLMIYSHFVYLLCGWCCSSLPIRTPPHHRPSHRMPWQLPLAFCSDLM
jgi:hypothetical protein